MKNRRTFVVALLYALLALTVILAPVHLIVWLIMTSEERQALAELLAARLPLITAVLLLTLFGLTVIVHLLHRRHVQLPLQLDERLTVMLGPAQSTRLPEEGPPGLRALVRAVNALADQRDARTADLNAQIRDAVASVEQERNRFAALISELAQSVIVCNAEGRILLFNARARNFFRHTVTGDAAPVGLGRSIFGVIDRSLISHGIDTIEQRLRTGEPQAGASFVTTAPSGQLIRIQMAPVSRPEIEAGNHSPLSLDGYVLILEDVTRRVELETQRDRLLQSLTEGARASLANLRAATENLCDYPDMEPRARDRFLRIVREEAQAMSRRVDTVVHDYADALKVRWPLEDMLAGDLIQAARQRVEQRVRLSAKVEGAEPVLWIRVDSYSLLQGITYLAARLKEEFRVREIRFRLGSSGRLVHLDLVWSDVVVSPETFLGWELEPLRLGGEANPLTLREIIERHDGEVWFQRDKPTNIAFCRILLPSAATPDEVPVETEVTSRPDYYDFDLFGQVGESTALDDTPLAQLTYTVFDTETTGLDPSAGDEIIQIGAVRIVNGRLLRSDVFDQLVDPRRPVSLASRQIHGLTREMLVGQPTIEQVLPRFHGFCEDTVLVAHNAAFDMRFLQLKERASGVAFRQPVLDTLLLSQVIHPNQERHSLEYIAERLDVPVLGRHTALGDAFVTGEVLLKMLPLLAQKGIHTLAEARAACARTYYAKLAY